MSILIPRVSTLRPVCTKGNFRWYLRLFIACVCRGNDIVSSSLLFGCWLLLFIILCFYSYIRVVRIASNARPVPTTDGNHINRSDRYSI